MQALDKIIQTQKLTWAENNPSEKTRTTICKLKHFLKNVGCLTSQCENDTGFIMYHFIQNFVLGKAVYPTMDIPLLCKQVAVQLILNKYVEFTPIYEPMGD